MNPPPSATPPGQADLRPPPTLALFLRQNAALHTAALFLYYLGIIVALILIYGRGDFTAAPFVYQGF